ncbi:coenzyme F390 synthetase [Lachnospiraceae bacterium KM106-2]|nr:coenzyme F390 synthetase [Lachnospiraceae bacterium KM106-2]
MSTQVNFNDIEFLCGSAKVLEAMPETPARRMFDEKTLTFFGALSKQILSDHRAKAFPDVVSYAFWIRKNSLLKERERYQDREHRLGRGISFHIAPSNVPVNFAVSMTSALLAGNQCIIRVSNKQFEQVDIIVDAINAVLLKECKDMTSYLCIVRYEHSEEITQYFSSLCDIRIIWGGNRTIDQIRKASLPPRTIEMAFADRNSLAVINSDQYLKMDAKKVAKEFYTDTYYMDQNACSSPRMVIWTGTKKEEAREQFWDTLEKMVKHDYELKPISCVNKFNIFCMLGAKTDQIHLVSHDNYIVRVEVDKLFDGLMDYKEGAGYFFEYLTDDLEELTTLFKKSCQTLSYLGVDPETLKDLVIRQGTRGVDRIVPMGQTMELSFYWDGYDMIENMTRYLKY